MTQEEIALRLEDYQHEIGSLKHRMRSAEESARALNRLVTAVEVLATKQSTMSDSLERLTGKVDALEAKPARRWEALADKALWAVAGAFFARLLQSAVAA